MNIQPKHGQCDSSISLKTISFKLQQGFLLLTGLGIYPKNYRRNPCHAVLGLFQISQKERFFISRDKQRLMGLISKSALPP